MENYLLSVLIAFISIMAIQILSYPILKKQELKANWIRVCIQSFLISLIPIFKWLWIALIIIVGFVLSNDDFAEEIKEKLKKRGK